MADECGILVHSLFKYMVLRLRPVRRLAINRLCMVSCPECNASDKLANQESGLHIYMGGVGLQQLFIINFSILVVQVLWGVRRVEKDVDRARRATLILIAVLVVLLLITVRPLS